MSMVRKNASIVLQGAGLLLAALLCAPWACSSNPGIKGGSGGSGGSDGGAVTGSGGTGGGSSCASVTPCGGDITGTWNVTSCLTVSGGTLNTSGFLGCASAPITGGSLNVTGTFTAKSDGTYSDNTVTSGTEQFTLDKACMVYSSTPITCTDAQTLLKGLGFDSVSCASTTAGGCDCSGTVQQPGGIGVLSADLSTTGSYKTAMNVATLSGSLSSTDLKFPYCVAGNQMTWAPPGISQNIKGTVTFQKQAGGPVGTGGGMGGGGAGGSTGSGGTGGTGGGGTGGSTPPPSQRPCDIFAAAKTPCVAAHSTVRAMFASYTGNLYQVKKVSDGTTKDIAVDPATGIAKASDQDAFCGTTSKACTISIIYDQTGNGNNLTRANTCPTCNSCPPMGAATQGKPATEAFADLAPITIGGHKAYGVHMTPCGGGQLTQTGYRCDTPKNTATGASPESVYFVVDGTFTNASCCWDYGNASTHDTAGGMDAIEFSSTKLFGAGGDGTGPWVGQDPEGGIVNGATATNPKSLSLPYPFVTALMKNNESNMSPDGGPFVLKGGDARSGMLIEMWNGALSNHGTKGKGGGIILGIGGDGAAGGRGRFFEGAMTTSFLSKATDDALQANIVAAGYGK